MDPPTDVDECSENVCPQNCTNTIGSYQCSCWDGYDFPVDCISKLICCLQLRMYTALISSL